MSFRSIAAKSLSARLAAVMTVGATLVSGGLTHEFALRAQSPPTAGPSRVRLPDEAAGLVGIVRTLISAFDQTDIVALGETHGRFRVDSDLRIALVRHPDFAKRIRSIVIECGSTTEQSTLDRYVRGENVPRAQLERVWKATVETTNGFCDAPEYPDFLASVRDVNSRLPADARIRVLGGHPGPGANRSIGATVVSVLKEPVLQERGKALAIFGAAHFYRTLPKDFLSGMGSDVGLARSLEVSFPGRTFMVLPIGRLDRPRGAAVDVDPEFQKFDRALKTQVRPVLVSLHRLPFRDFSAEEFLGRTMMSCRGAAGCVSAFKGSALTLGQMADACVYVGGGADGLPENSKTIR